MGTFHDVPETGGRLERPGRKQDVLVISSARGAVAASFRTLLSGEADGQPAWVRAIGTGDADSLVPVGGAAWTVHGSLTTLVGGVRALLLQALHPAAVTAVSQHSAFRDDPVGRLRRTTRWLTVTTFADRATVLAEAERVTRMHTRVAGDLPGGGHYAASDPVLLRWVHLAFTDSFLTAHLALGGAPIPGGPDAYVSEWAASAELLGATGLPHSRAEMDAQLQEYRASDLHRVAATAEIVEFLRNPPLPAAHRAAYRLLSAAAVSTLDPRDAELLGISRPRTQLAIPPARAVIGALGLVLGTTSPAQRAALERVATAPAS